MDCDYGLFESLPDGLAYGELPSSDEGRLWRVNPRMSSLLCIRQLKKL